MKRLPYESDTPYFIRLGNTTEPYVPNGNLGRDMRQPSDIGAMAEELEKAKAAIIRALAAFDEARGCPTQTARLLALSKAEVVLRELVGT